MEEESVKKISSETVRADFNDVNTVVHYARAAHFLGLWKSERMLIERFFPDLSAPLLEAGCGAGRVTLGLWDMGYTRIAAFDFAEELLDQARSLATERGATSIQLFLADATRLRESLPPLATNQVCHVIRDKPGLENPPDAPSSGEGSDTVCHVLRDKGAGFAGALFMFNGLMQIPGRENRRKALRELAAVCAPGAPLLFTTHDRNSSRMEKALWRLEAVRWETGQQDTRLVEFGDRYFEDETGRTFMHLPDRNEIMEDLAETGWNHEFDSLRRELASEPRSVRDFSDECRFWVGRKGSENLKRI